MLFGRSLGGAVGAALARDNSGKVDLSKFIPLVLKQYHVSFSVVMAILVSMCSEVMPVLMDMISYGIINLLADLLRCFD